MPVLLYIPIFGTRYVPIFDGFWLSSTRIIQTINSPQHDTVVVSVGTQPCWLIGCTIICNTESFITCDGRGAAESAFSRIVCVGLSNAIPV